MKNKTLIILLFLIVFLTKAQQLPIETKWENVTNGNYLKDFNNILNKYEGTWIATIGNKQVKLVIDKKLYYPVKTISRYYYSDALLMRYEVKVNGQIVESTLDFADNDIKIICEGPISSDNNSINVADFFSHGTLCNVGWGWIYLTYIDATHLKWYYYVQTVQLSSETCPDLQTAQNLDINLPYEPENIIFTKQ